MAQIKLNVQSSDKLKALIGDLGIECEIPVSALVEYAKGQVTLDDVVKAGNETNTYTAFNAGLSAGTGIGFATNTLDDVNFSGLETVTQDRVVILTIGGERFKIAAQVIS